MGEQERKNNRKLINTYIKRKDYGEFTGIIREIVERRYLTYSTTMKEDRIKEELEAFTLNLKRIRFAKSEDYDKVGPNTMGAYSYDDKEIILFRDRIDDLEALYDVLTHELYHVLGTSKNKEGTALKYNDEKKGELVGTALNESFNEYGAYLAYAKNRKETEEKEGINTRGYQTIVFIPRLLSAALGIPEATIVGKGLKNREELLKSIYLLVDDTMEAKNKEYYQFQKFENNLNVLYNLDFDKGAYPNLDKKLRDSIRKSAVKSIIEYGYTELTKMIKNNAKTLKKEDVDSINRYAYCYYKLEEVSAEVISQMDNPKDQEELTEWLKNKRDVEGTLITDINKIFRVKDKISDKKDYREYLKLACEENIDLAIDWINVKYGIDISKEKEKLGYTLRKEDALKSEFAKFMEEKDYKDLSKLDGKRKMSMIRLKLIVAKEKINSVIIPKILRATNRMLGVQPKLPEHTETIENKRVETKENSNEKSKEIKTEVVNNKKETNPIEERKEEKKKISSKDKDDDEER